MRLKKLIDYLDNTLDIKTIPDDSLNGLQVENTGYVNKVALAVDVSLEAIKMAKKENADFLLVHHGLFWRNPIHITGATYQRIKHLMKADIALYAVHLPLDIHPELGNNAQIEDVLGWPVYDDFGMYHGLMLGKEVRFSDPVPLKNITKRIHDRLHIEPIVWAFGPEKITRLGYISGGAISILPDAIQEGMDAYITGETRHASYWEAKEAGIHVIFAGHYKTETLGVKAVGRKLEDEFGLETVFIDLPTGY